MRKLFRSPRFSRMVIITSVVLLAVLFLYTGISKVVAYSNFKKQIADSALLAPFAGLLAWALPAVEILTAAALLTRKWRLPALYASFVLMLFFTGYVVWLLYFMIGVACGCGGVLESMSWEQHLAFNIFFTVLALVALLLEKMNRKRTQAAAGHLPFP